MSKKNKSKSQKIVSYIPSTEEWHIGGYNFNGMGTKTSDRLSLNYKGGVGSESSFLPVNKLDYNAFRHDLLYFAPDDITRAYADSIYLKNLNTLAPQSVKTLSSSIMLGIYAKRMIGVPLSLISSMYGVAISSQKLGKDITTFIKSTKYHGPLFNQKTGVMPKWFKEFASKHLNIKGAQGSTPERRGSQREKFIKALGFGVLYYGSTYFTKPVKNGLKMVNLFMSSFELNADWKKLKKENNKVMKSYNEYLRQVGEFKNDDFKIKTDINESVARSKYEKFFAKYQDYLRFVNKAYIEYDGFKQIPIPELNSGKIKEVTFPTMQTPKEIVLTDSFKEQVKNVKEKIGEVSSKEISDEITKTLAGIQDKPFTSKVQETPEEIPEVTEKDSIDPDEFRNIMKGVQRVQGESLPSEDITISRVRVSYKLFMDEDGNFDEEAFSNF